MVGGDSSQSHSFADTPTPAEAIALQRMLAAQVCCEDRFGSIRTVGGIDVAYGHRGGPARAAAVVLSFPGLEVIDRASAVLPAAFPYIPGLLSFREAPAAMAAFRLLSTRPDVLLVDGHGLAHPRRCGIACHLGLLLDVPAIGVGKSRLVGDFEEPGAARGERAVLLHRGETVGVVLRSRAGVRPIFVSVGHRVSLDSAVAIVLHCVSRYRLPEPIRLADRLSRVADEGVSPESSAP